MLKLIILPVVCVMTIITPFHSQLMKSESKVREHDDDSNVFQLATNTFARIHNDRQSQMGSMIGTINYDEHKKEIQRQLQEEIFHIGTNYLPHYQIINTASTKNLELDEDGSVVRRYIDRGRSLKRSTKSNEIEIKYAG